MPFRLTIFEHDGPPRQQVLPRETVFFGRREDNDVVLPFTFVSSRHGRLFLREGSVFVEDMGSTNGTMVNGEPLTPMIARALKPDDRVQIDKIAIQARWSEGPVRGDAESATYHEMDRPSALATTSKSNALNGPSPPLPARESKPSPRVRSSPGSPAPDPQPPEDASPLARARIRPDRVKTSQLGQASFSSVLASGRPRPVAEVTERDRYLAWEVFFKTVGLLAVLGGLALLVFVLVA
jgi:hypothetical protein